ncbi:MAG: CHAT domain-containing protein [Deltaproteobacteria bacterium]|nr:CHAT domain-containing protein [Deltaproteobacteria bacterium]
MIGPINVAIGAQVGNDRAIPDAPAPDPAAPKAELLKAYLARMRAAGVLGDRERQLREFNEGIKAIGPKDPLSYELYHEGANVVVEMGDWKTGREMRENAMAVTNDRGRKFFQSNFLSNIAVRLYDKAAALKYIALSEELLDAVRASHRDWPNFRDLWEAALGDAKGGVHSFLGYPKEAEAEYRACVGAIRSYLAKNRPGSDVFYYYLPQCLSRAMEHAALTGKIREAGAYVNDAREAARIHGQRLRRESFEAGRVARPIARVYLEQGLIREGTALIESSIAQLQKAPGGEASIQVADLRYLLAQSEMAQGNWLKADEIFQLWRESLRKQIGELGTIAPEWSYALLRLGRAKEALAMAGSILKFREKFDDERSVRLHEGRAFHALAAGATGQRDAAVKTLAAAIPKILDARRDLNTSGEDGYISSARLSWLLDGYISLLADMQQRGARIDGVDPSGEAFKIVDAARGSKVQKALSAAIVRASSSDPQTAEAMRRAQDAEHALKAASEAVTVLQNAEKSADNAQALAKAQAELARVRQENEKAQAELRLKMPNYVELMQPKPLTIADAQKLLRADEALISLYSAADKTLVWAMTARGQVAFQVADLSQTALTEVVSKLRKALDPSDADINKLPGFDYDAAYDLYRRLLAPVEAGWKGARELVIISHGPLSELPLSVLVTAPFKPVKSSQSAAPLSEHADAPWLIKQAAISYLPSLTALASLRTATTQPASRNFIGFGDPLFKDAQAQKAAAAAMASRGIVRRNATAPGVVEKAAQMQRRSSNLELLEPLPDTSDEVKEIAKILRADESKDVNLGQHASEQLVKSTDLSQYRVVMFATHGLVPGELPDLPQPALALSNPNVTNEKEDGLLTLAEILDLKLKADWVVLSACNTASADGQASEAVSGLGRAFFFAGAKALLVSHWPVETVSAKLLTTELFKRQSSDAKLSRAQAMREAALSVMKQSAKQGFSYAHPMFWAPFVVVGDGG